MRRVLAQVLTVGYKASRICLKSPSVQFTAYRQKFTTADYQTLRMAYSIEQRGTPFTMDYRVFFSE